MYLIEPCCAKKHLRELRDSIAKGGTKQFKGFGDLSLTELLPALLTRYVEVDMTIVAPTLPDQAAEIIGTWMRRQRARMDGKGNMDYIAHLTIITDLENDKSPMASLWLQQNPFGERLQLINRKQEDTVILLPDIALYGPINLRYGYEFIAAVTTEPDRVAALWEQFASLSGDGSLAEQTSEKALPGTCPLAAAANDEPANKKPAQAIRPKQAAKRKKHRKG